MENQTNENNASPAKTVECSCARDWRTFFIALLTSLIVVALYHFGSGLYKIYCGGYEDGCKTPYAKACYVIPVNCPMMMGASHCGKQGFQMQCPMKKRHAFRHHKGHHEGRRFRGERRGERRMHHMQRKNRASENREERNEEAAPGVKK